MRDELLVPIQSEGQVVYMLVEVRKVIEQIKEELGEDSYPTLELYCNWAVHPRMDRRSARSLVKLIDDLFSRLSNSGLSPEESERLGNILSFQNFRRELEDFLRENDLPFDMCTNEGIWFNFLKYYSLVIEDCPLVCQSDDAGLQRIDSVVFSKHIDREPEPKANPPNVPGFRINWEFFYHGNLMGRLVLTPEHRLEGSEFYSAVKSNFFGER